MYPSGELTVIARRKNLLRATIAKRRTEHATAIAQLVQPLVWFDRARRLWPFLGPFIRGIRNSIRRACR